MEKFYIIANSVKDKNLEVTRQIVDYLKKNKKECLLETKTEDAGQEKKFDYTDAGQEEEYHYTDPGQEKNYRYTDAGQIPDDIDCILVLGGDGTLLQAARDVVDKGIPLFGINMGTLGYLAEIERHSIYPALDHLILDEYEVEERMMIKGTVYRGREALGSDIALNDIVIRRNGPLRVVRFKNYVNEEYLNTYNADGIIIATPTGSTGYSLSAGGPIVSPTASMLLMTPLAPHTLNTRSILFDEKDRITVEIGPGRTEGPEHALATFDGDTNLSMMTGDKIVIEKSDRSTKIVKTNHISFLEILRKKMSNN